MQSAKTNQNVEQVFFTMARDIKQRLTETVAAATEVAYVLMQLLSPFHQSPRKPSPLIFHQTMQPPTIQISRPDPDQAGAASSRWSSCCNTWSVAWWRNRTAVIL